MAVPDQQQPNPTVQRLINAAAAGQAAQTTAGATGVAVTLPARAVAGVITVPVEAFAHGVKVAIILRVLRGLLRRTHTDSADWLTQELRKLFPNADPNVIRQAVETELRFEQMFQQKGLKRVEADLHKAGALPTPEAQQKRVNEILNREKHYAGLREKAMMNRAKGHVQNAEVKAASPLGATWVLGKRKTHTAGCVALAGKNWPWEVLDTIPPPLHSNCGCELKPLGPTDTVPPVGTAIAMAKAAMALEEALRGERAQHELREINWSEFLHPRGRGGKWEDKPGGLPHEPKPKVKPPTYMPVLSPDSTVISGAKPEGDTILGGNVPEPAHQAAIPSLDHVPLTLQLPPAFGADHIKAKSGADTYLVKDHGGDRSHVASELLANGVYRELGVDVPTMGRVKTAPEPDFAKRAEDLPDEPPIDAEPHARISTGIVLREPDGRINLIEPRNHYGGYIHTFPKGGVEPNLTPQQNAHKELWEETGLHAHITGVIGDFKGDTGVTRYYEGVRTGGKATPSDETEAIKTVLPDEAAQMLNKQRDQDVLAKLLERPVPTGTFEDQFPPKVQGSGLAVKAVDGKTRDVTSPSEALGRGYMADALLANRNFLGQRGENVRWPTDDKPIRTHMANTLGYGASGKHSFGDTPEEVWTMRTRGQAAGTVPQGEEELRQQAANIARILTDAKIDELAKAAPFPDPKERKQVAKALKARVAWMRRFADGTESLPEPATGAEARAQFADAQTDFEIYPEERQALDEYALKAGRSLDEHLQSGKDHTDADRKLAKTLDTMLGAARAPVDSHVYIGVPGAANKGMVGKAFSMKPYIRAHTNMADAKGKTRMRLLVPGDARALHLEDAKKGEPDMLLPRGQRVHVTGTSMSPDGVQQLDAIALPYRDPPRIPSDWKPKPYKPLYAAPGPKQPKLPTGGTFFAKGDRVDINGEKATVTGDAGKGKANIKTDAGKGYTVPFASLKRLQEADSVGDFKEFLHPRGRGGKWIGKPFQRDTPAKPSAIDAGVEYAKRAFDSSYHWPNSEAEKGNDGVTKYVEDGYAEINGALRHADKAGPVDPGYEIEAMSGDLPMRLDGAIKSIDAAIAGSRTKEDVTVFRGMDHREFGKLRVGDEIEPPAYSSTSLRQSQGSGWGDTLAEIRVPKGSHALAMDQAGFGGSENEVLLPRATRMRVVSTDPLTMEVVSQPKAPPLIRYDEPAAKKAERAQRRAQAQAIAKATKVGQKVTTRPGTQWARDVAVTAVDTDRGLLELGKGYWVDATDPKLGLAEAAGADRRDKYVWQPGDFHIYRNGDLLEAADYTEALHPRGRGGKWIGKFDTSKLEKTQTKDAATAAESAIREATGRDLVPFKLTQLPDDDAATARSRRGNEIALHEDSAAHTQTSAIVHEYAHGIDRMRNEDDWFTQTPAFQPLYKALMASPTVKKLKADEVEIMKGDDRGRAQLLQGRELLARAFEQYVAERGGNEMLRERMRKIVADPLLGFQHWQPDEFKPIADEMEKALAHIHAEHDKLDAKPPPGGEWDRSGEEPVWRQPHDELMREAMYSWRGWPSDMALHMADEEAGAPQPGSGNGKQRRAQAAALLQELDRAPTNPVRLYRGTTGDRPGTAQSWSSDRKVAEHWAGLGGGQVQTMEPGSAKALRMGDYVNDDVEKQWIARAGDKLQEADFKEFLHPRSRGGHWIDAPARQAPAAATAIENITNPPAPPIHESMARIEALGIDVVPPGKKSKLSNQEAADIADVIEKAFKDYPVLNEGPGPRVRRVEFTSGGHGKLKPGVLADCGVRPASHKEEGGGNTISQLRFNDNLSGYGMKPSGPPPPGTQIGGTLAPATRSWAGVTWHELGHAMMNAIDMAGHHDSKRYVDWMSRYGVSFDDCKGVSTYAVASRSEGIAELSAMENTPGYSALLPPDLEGKAHKMFEDLRNWNVGTPYTYQKPLIDSPKPKATPTPKAKVNVPTASYTMPSPAKLTDIEAAVKASPGVAGEKKPVSELGLAPGDVIEGGTPGLRYVVIADPSEKTGLRYVPLNQGQHTAYSFSPTSKRRKVNNLHFELQEGNA